ncbi:MAG: protocatechuate 3,4-dioxygenase [Chromatiaceae bacterium]|jgi:protocatechuate 3,4-dioxygenase beta subunit|nr:protocatechuate 3,4-dioxygenase [Chromatiaceae bacterium]
MPAIPRALVRRRLIVGIASSAALAALPKSLLAALLPTPRQSLGPFYPDTPPLDRDNDLVQIAGREELAKGEITDLSGRVVDQDGQPVAGALVEIWQCDANGRYLHSRDTRAVPRDPNFQGYGRYTTGADGRYRFRTIKPVPYPGRAPHIHFAVSAPGREPLVTQMYVRGAPENTRDWLLNGVPDPAAREALIVAFQPAPGNPLAQLKAELEIVLP